MALGRSLWEDKPAERTSFGVIEGDGKDIMRPRRHFIASFIAWGLVAASCLTAAAAPVEWARYKVPESGATVDLPTSIFSYAAGELESGYGGRFLTSDRRADLTIQSLENDARLSPAVFLARKKPPPGI